jgi:hypothetical protein
MPTARPRTGVRRSQRSAAASNRMKCRPGSETPASVFCAFMPGLLALGLPDPRQVLCGSWPMGWRAVRARVRAGKARARLCSIIQRSSWRRSPQRQHGATLWPVQRSLNIACRRLADMRARGVFSVTASRDARGLTVAGFRRLRTLGTELGTEAVQLGKHKKIILIEDYLAEGVGFEPTVGLHPRRFSRPVP